MTTDFEDDATELIAPLDPGAFLAERYRIDKRLSGGASGEVYLATDTRRGGLAVAIKVLHARGASAETRKRFEREGAVLAGLDHPGVVRVLDAGESVDGRPFLVMERLDGETLEQRLARLRVLPIADALRIVAFAADAIDAVHEIGVLHRDLSPANVFLPATGSTPVKLIDFGYSRAASEQRLTATGTAIGTPRYVAPEQIVSVKSAGKAADVYSLGVCAYEMIAGESPFDTHDRGQLLGAVLHGRHVPLHQKRPDVPAGVSHALARAMAHEPSERYAAASELAAALYVGSMLAPPADLPKRVARQLRPQSLSPPAAGRVRTTTPPPYLTPPPRSTPVPATQSRPVGDTGPASAQQRSRPLGAPIAPPHVGASPAGPSPIAERPTSRKWLVLAVVAMLFFGIAACAVAGLFVHFSG